MIEDKLLNKLRERQLELSAQLVEVPVDSFEKYQNIVGRYQGIQECLSILAELLRGEDDID